MMRPTGPESGEGRFPASPEPIAPGNPRQPVRQLLNELMKSSVILDEDWLALPAEVQREIATCTNAVELSARLAEHGLLTDYQAGQVSAGRTFGLMLGNYRVLGRLGKGGMGQVFLAEQVVMRKRAAVKVLSQCFDESPENLRLFHAEMRAVARLDHPNIVAAFDAGVCTGPHPNSPVWHYLVMEYVPGEDLQQYVEARGPLRPALACDLICQMASALQAAHRNHLVHRDIKPANVVVTPEGQAKLLDFGVVRTLRDPHVESGTPLDTLGYMAPEQVADASSVDIRADIFALGGTLYWCLTGQPPFPSTGNVLRDLMDRMTRQPPAVASARPDLPPALAVVVTKAMAFAREDRYATPQALLQALEPFTHLEIRDARLPAAHAPTAAASHTQRLLIVDDDPDNRLLCRFTLEGEGYACEEADDGEQALRTAHARRPDLILLDIDMPRMNGAAVLQQLRQTPPSTHLKVVMMSAAVSSDEMASLLAAGADDYLSKPLSIVQLLARVKAALRLKDAQERGDQLNRRLVTTIGELERKLGPGPIQSRNHWLLALAELAGTRSARPAAHLRRLQRYSRCLAEKAASLPQFASQITPDFVDQLEYSVPLHDIGNLELPDHILHKAGKFLPDERRLMQGHTSKGAELLDQLAQRYGTTLGLPRMAVEVACHHHERYDGQGYPAGLTGHDIPLVARLMTFADGYDALRSRRAYRPAFSHAVTVQIMTEGMPGHFDPLLLDAFRPLAFLFERIFRAAPD